MDNMVIDLHPVKCNICGGEVEYIEIKDLYGENNLHHDVGSKYCYHCKCCGAAVGTHKGNPTEAFGLLANKEMAKMRRECHKLFDHLWSGKKEREAHYEELAKRMNIDIKNCHFAYFTLEQLKEAYEILLKWWREEYDK